MSVAPALQVTSSYTAPCVLSLVSQDADIVLIEFTFNDSQRGNHKLEDPTTCAPSFRIVTSYLLRPCSSDRQRAFPTLKQSGKVCFALKML